MVAVHFTDDISPLKSNRLVHGSSSVAPSHRDKPRRGIAFLGPGCLSSESKNAPSDHQTNHRAGHHHQSTVRDNHRSSPETVTSRCHAVLNAELTTMDADTTTGTVLSNGHSLLPRKTTTTTTSTSTPESFLGGPKLAGQQSISKQRASPPVLSKAKAESPSSTTTERSSHSPALTQSPSLVSTTTGLLQMATDGVDEFGLFDGSRSPRSSSSSGVNKRYFTNSRERWR